MRKIFFTLFLLGAVLSAQAGPYFSSTNQLAKLLEQIEGFAAGEPLYANDGTTANGPDDAWWDIPGFIFKDSGEPGKPGGGDDRTLLEYRGDEGVGSDNYWSIRAIDWRNKGYVQKASSIGIELIQPADISRDNAREAEDYELRWLKYVDFSGNKFHTVTVAGNGLLERLEFVDLSNNPTLKSLSVSGCVNPDFKVDISQNGFSFGKIFDLCEKAYPPLFDNDNRIVSWLEYGDQGIISRAFAADNVDLYYDADDFAFATTYTFTDKNGDPLSPTVLGKGKFAFPTSMNGQEVTCVAKCDYFPKLPDGITFLITLTDDLEMIGKVAISPQSPLAYAGEPVSFNVEVTDYNGDVASGVSVKWESASGVFDDDTSFNPVFMPNVAGSVEVKCVATQTRAGKPDAQKEASVTFNVNDAREVSDINVVFNQDIYLLGEEVPFNITVTDQYGTRNTTEGVKITTELGTIDAENKIYIASATGLETVTFEAGSMKEVINFYVIEDNPIEALDVEVSSFKDDENPANVCPPEALIDGNHTTRWAGSQHTDEGGLGDDRSSFPEWVIVDLGEVFDICMIEVDWESSRASAWELLISEDKEDWTSLGSYGTTPGGNNHFVFRTPVQGKAQYIKIFIDERSNGSWNASIWEITAYKGTLSETGIEKLKYPSVNAYYYGGELIINNGGKTITDIYSITGQKVLSSTAATINVSALGKGCYIARVIGENGTVSAVKFIK